MGIILTLGAFNFALASESVSPNHKLIITHQDGVTDAADHVYKAYQILTGDLSGSEAEGYVLANMKWGANAPSGKTTGNKLTSEEVTAVKAWTVDSVKSLTPTGTSNHNH